MSILKPPKGGFCFWGQGVRPCHVPFIGDFPIERYSEYTFLRKGSRIGLYHGIDWGILA